MSKHTSLEDYIDLVDGAKRLKIHRQTLRRLIKQEKDTG